MRILVEDVDDKQRRASPAYSDGCVRTLNIVDKCLLSSALLVAGSGSHLVGGSVASDIMQEHTDSSSVGANRCQMTTKRSQWSARSHARGICSTDNGDI